MNFSEQKVELKRIEKELNINLPKQYFDFLLKNNSFVPEKNVFTAKEHGESILKELYGIRPDSPVRDINNNRSVFKDRIPNEFIPIGCDQLGNQIILGIRGEYLNKIYFWWHEGENDEDELVTYSNIYEISETFNEFVESLQEYWEEKKGNFEDYFRDEDYDKIKNFVNSGWNVNTIFKNKLTAIQLMVMYNNQKVVDLLINNGASLKETAERAITNRLPKMLEKLLKAGVNPNERNSQNDPLLNQAIMEGNIDATSILISFKADKNLKDNFDFTPMALAEKLKARGEKNMGEIIKLLSQ